MQKRPVRRSDGTLGRERRGHHPVADQRRQVMAHTDMSNQAFHSPPDLADDGHRPARVARVGQQGDERHRLRDRRAGALHFLVTSPRLGGWRCVSSSLRPPCRGLGVGVVLMAVGEPRHRAQDRAGADAPRLCHGARGGGFYVRLFRGTPVLIQLLFCANGLLGAAHLARGALRPGADQLGHQ